MKMCMISLFFVNTDHADVLSYEEMNKIYLKGAVSDHFIQFPTKLASSWLRAYILNAPRFVISTEVKPLKPTSVWKAVT